MPPLMEGYRPFGISINEIDSIVLLYEEFEALRLVDYEGLIQEEAAVKMKISRPTFTRVYEKARKSIARAFVEGKAIIIRGGDYITDDYWYKCEDCKKTTVSVNPVNHCRQCDSANISLLTYREEK